LCWAIVVQDIKPVDWGRRPARSSTDPAPAMA
jgi:hypothetical protein